MNKPADVQVMVDLETMGTASDSAIVAIGAVNFSKEHGVTGTPFYINVDLQSCLDVGLQVDGSTVMWWLKQSEEARTALLTGEPIPIAKALHIFSIWMKLDRNIWGNGASFDNAILATAYKKCGSVQPWEYEGDRCYRTVKNLYPDIEMQRVGTHHNALDDAKSQALHLIKIMREKDL